jgi:hypothetical protein
MKTHEQKMNRGCNGNDFAGILLTSKKEASRCVLSI